MPSVSKIEMAAPRIASRLRRASARRGRVACVATITPPLVDKVGNVPTYSNWGITPLMRDLTSGVTMAERLDGRTVLVTGANGGLGEQFVRQALERGARKVYATARNPRPWDDERIVPIALDLTDPASVAAVAQTATDVDLVVNNAGIAPADDGSVVTGDEDVARRIFETNYFGTVRVAKAFAP